MVVYELPFGGGRQFNPGNAFVRALISDWRVSSITRIMSGLPYGIVAGACQLPNAGGCRASYNPNFSGDVRINGDWGSGDLLGARPQFLDPRAFVSPGPFTYGNTPGAGSYGLYNPGSWNEDLGVARQFPITERFKLNFSAEVFNLSNTVIFNGPASLDINNANFGRITGQQSTPRSIQFALKLTF